MNNCIFCKIIKNEVPAAKVLEDDKILAFLDINPIHRGHTLVIPKIHYNNMLETPEELLAYIFIKSKKIMLAIKEAQRADYVAVSVVGLDVSHFHVHLVPRYENDGLANWWPTKKYSRPEEMQEVATRIREKL